MAEESNRLLRVQVKREVEGGGGLGLPFRDLERVQELVQVLSHSDVEDLVVEIRFGQAANELEPQDTDNGRLDEESELSAVEASAKYTYG